MTQTESDGARPVDVAQCVSRLKKAAKEARDYPKTLYADEVLADAIAVQDVAPGEYRDILERVRALGASELKRWEKAVREKGKSLKKAQTGGASQKPNPCCCSMRSWRTSGTR